MIIITEMVLFMFVILIGVESVLPYFLRVYITHLIGRRTHGRENENTPEMNSVLAEEGRVFSTTLDIEITFTIKRIKPDES